MTQPRAAVPHISRAAVTPPACGSAEDSFVDLYAGLKAPKMLRICGDPALPPVRQRTQPRAALHPIALRDSGDPGCATHFTGGTPVPHFTACGARISLLKPPIFLDISFLICYICSCNINLKIMSFVSWILPLSPLDRWISSEIH